jgi:hypothetical protein
VLSVVLNPVGQQNTQLSHTSDDCILIPPVAAQGGRFQARVAA